MRGLGKNCMKRDMQTRKHTDGHRDSMKESAKGRFFEKDNPALVEREIFLPSFSISLLLGEKHAEL